MSTEPCPLCGQTVQLHTGHPSADAKLFDCKTCGRFAHEGISAQVGFSPSQKSRRYLLSAYTKSAESSGYANLVTINAETLKRLDEGRFTEPAISTKLETVVRWVEAQAKEFGDFVTTDPIRDYPIATCRSPAEWTRVWLTAIEMGLLDAPQGAGADPRKFQVSLSYKGVEWLTARPNALSPKGFIAMAFSKDLDPLKAAISKGIRAAGYEPTRVDEEDYVGGVMDKIIALIRESRFVVADFTRNRGGVYYEAGFAFGLGIKVVQVCSQAQLDSEKPSEKLHFDVNHLNCLAWTEDKLGEFSDRLRDRILAIFGRGPIKQTDGVS